MICVKLHYQLLLHRWDVVGASVDKCGVVLAEEHRVEHLFTWKKIKEICVRHLNMAVYGNRTHGYVYG